MGIRLCLWFFKRPNFLAIFSSPFLFKLEPNAKSTTAIAFSPKDASSDDNVCKSPAVSTSSVMPASFNVSKDIRPFSRYTLYSLLQYLKAEIIAFAASPSGSTRFTGSQGPHPHPLPRRGLILFAVASYKDCCKRAINMKLASIFLTASAACFGGLPQRL